jgi:hypothetical protein
MELVDGEGLGRHQRLHGRWGRKRSEIDQEIVAYEPGSVLGWRHLAERLDGKPAPRFAAETVSTITLVPPGTARWSSSSPVRFRRAGRRGLVMRAFGGREVSKLLERSLDQLSWLASQPPA